MRRTTTLSGRDCFDRSGRFGKQRMRCGAAAVEFAVVAPVITLIFLSSLNAMQQITVSHNLRLVSHMAAVEFATSSKSVSDLESRFEDFGTQVGLRDIRVSIKRYDGDIYNVRASVPIANNNPIVTYSSDTLIANSYAYRANL